MTEPLPNWRSICASAVSSDFSRSAADGIACLLRSRRWLPIGCRSAPTRWCKGLEPPDKGWWCVGLTLRSGSDIRCGPTGAPVTTRLRMTLMRRLRRFEQVRCERRTCRRRASVSAREASRRPTPYQRSAGTSVARHSASQISRGVDAGADAPAPPCGRPGRRARGRARARARSSHRTRRAMAFQNSLQPHRINLTAAERANAPVEDGARGPLGGRRSSVRRSATRSGRRPRVGVELGDELVGQRVGDRVEALDDREAVSDLAHDHRDRGVERVGDRREDLRLASFWPRSTSLR